ncbi:MAG TPA: hypothetical protein VK582_17005 [Pyrinomonadaceae bacterium]|nr:hypothetical protein [Pyrinomonadaceae bacterium]
MPARYVASEMLIEAAQRHNIHLSVLVAETALWAHPDVHARLLSETGTTAPPTRGRAC